MVLSLSYRRPAYVSSKRSTNQDSKATSRSSLESGSSTSTPCGIPDALAFDRVISGGACPPCTTRDFMNYLTYMEHSAENLQFYLWFKDYVKRFDALPSNEKALSQPRVPERSESVFHAAKSSRSTEPTGDMGAILKDIGFDSPQATVVERPNPFEDDDDSSKWDGETSTLDSSLKNNVKKSAAAAFESADVKFQPFTVQPFREEITRVVAAYIADGGARQLNLAARERNELLQALAVTTHPSAFREVLKTVEWTLRHQAHPNFIRWTICNGNKPRVICARVLGISFIILGLATIVLITLSSANRGWRAMAAIPLLMGTSTLFAAWKGMCVVLHGLHHRNLRPWELFVDDDQASSVYDMKEGSQQTFGSSNSYEDEPWVAKYEKRNLVRKVFDRQVWIQEPALRQIQDTIFLQSVIVAVLSTSVIVGAFVAIPRVQMY